MKRDRRTVLMTLCMAVFAVSAAMIVSLLFQFCAAEQTYREAEELARADASASPSAVPTASPTPAPTTEPELLPQKIADPQAAVLEEMDLSALQAVNEDVLGWLMIPDTVISYPLLQGEDNQYYLKHTWDKEQNRIGSLFLECTNEPDFSEFNTIIYGHNFESGVMFSELHGYKEQDFWSDHPYVYLLREDGVYRYAVYAAFEADVPGYVYRLNIEDEALKKEFISSSLEQSVIDTGVVPTVEDQLITLSTCVSFGAEYDRRWVVLAVLEGEITAEAEK